MDALQQYFSLEISSDHLSAKLHCTELYKPERIDETALRQFLIKEGIRFGIIKEAIHQIVQGLEKDHFPITIAKGKQPVHGKNAAIEFYFKTVNEKISETEEFDFREVMRIPSVKKGEKLALISEATKGHAGQSIYGEAIEAKDGLPIKLQAGKNVRFDEAEKTFYATDEGQATVYDNRIHVHSVYEIHESVSMKTGNVHFPGSIIIHGDVPSGFKVRANGDVKIFGMVEAAEIFAKGSVFIEEGLAGMKKGLIQAGKDAHLGYVNQGIVRAGKDILVENSILHSECVAAERIISKGGNIIGGSLSAGILVEAKEVGNRLNTKTAIHFGLDQELEIQLEQLEQDRIFAMEDREKIQELGRQIEARDYQTNVRLRIALLRQRNKLAQLELWLQDVESRIGQLEKFSGQEHEAKLNVSKSLYPNTFISFGKYMQKIEKDYGPIQAVLEQKEIFLRPLL